MSKKSITVNIILTSRVISPRIPHFVYQGTWGLEVDFYSGSYIYIYIYSPYVSEFPSRKKLRVDTPLGVNFFHIIYRSGRRSGKHGYTAEAAFRRAGNQSPANRGFRGLGLCQTTAFYFPSQAASRLEHQ